jgi:hypothetical protein
MVLMLLLQIGHEFSYSWQLGCAWWCWCNVEALHEATLFLTVFLSSSPCSTPQKLMVHVWSAY